MRQTQAGLEEEEKKKKRLIRKLKNKFRLVILNDASFEEKFSLRLSPLNVFVIFLVSSLILITIVTLVIAYTPLRTSIPGYADVNLRADLTSMVIRVDSLEQELSQKDAYVSNIHTILNGGVPEDQQTETAIDSNVIENPLPLQKSKEDSLLRDYIERVDAYSLTANDQDDDLSTSRVYFFTPLKGLVSNTFDPKNDHFGIDIVAPKDEAIMATLDGTVIFSGWTVETGYVIQLQHENNMLSVYKHNSVLLKKMGDVVKAGEAIAIIGNSGELTSGPHLHFELWRNGVALDPVEFVNFN